MTTRIATLLFSVGVLFAQEDVVMKAMRDEMARSMKELQLENLEKPYFIAYRVVDSESTRVAASFGALTHSNTGRSRMLNVEVRVGDYSLDNSNFFSFNFDGGTGFQIFNGNTMLPLDDDYKELRRLIWLATDSAYKKAVEDFSKKRAMFQNKTRSDDTADFTKENPVTSTEELPPLKINRSQWETETRNLSALFRKMPAINTSDVAFNAVSSYVRYLTSEGTSYTRRQPSIAFNASAATQASDGTPLDDFVWFHGRSVAEIPPEQELASRLQALGKTLTELKDASTLVNYNGPVLAEGDAAAQLFRLVFIPNLLGSRRVVSDMQGFQNNGNQAENPFIDKIGARVLPDFLSVTDDPTIGDYQHQRMTGFSKIDEDGMPTRQTKLIESGILKTLLTSRDPVRGVEHSTGSRHAGQATPSNVFVTSSNGLSDAEIRAKFIEMIKQRNRPFGILVRRMRNVNNPVLAYKVFPDGKEELIRGVQFFGLTAAAFRDIVAASKEQHILTVRFQPRNQMPMMTMAEENFTPVTLAVPSLLFEEATIRKIRAEAPNPPVAGHPFFDK
jgi:predicted Zn-dependent protease